MDVERTMQFILEHQARAVVEMEEIRAIQKDHSGRIQKREDLGARTDRRIEAIAKLLRGGRDGKNGNKGR